ncbi:MAG: hypothetical protein IKS03_10645 [Ruminococcus sp.]|nr:hypothetical protein [Ruminococcus sp.]
MIDIYEVMLARSSYGKNIDFSAYATSLLLEIDSSTYVVTATLKNKNGDTLGTPQTIDLPLETVVVGGSYDDSTKKVILTLKNGNTIEFSVADLVDGLQPEITANNKLSSDLVDDTNHTNKFVTSSEKSAWNGKQDALTFDSSPTANSNNPVKSGGIYTALSGKQNTINSSNKLSSDLVDDTNHTNKFVTAAEKTKIQNAITSEEYNAGKTIPSGTECTIDNVRYTVGNNAEIFNSYSLNKAVGDYSHAEGLNTDAIGSESHAEGYATTASGNESHSEGYATTASGGDSHAEGYMSTASGDYSHAEGHNATASGTEAHAEGNGTSASGDRSHAEGLYTSAASELQHVQGKYNVVDSNGKYAHIIGNGTGDNSRSNALAIDWDGKLYVNNSQTGVDVSVLNDDVEVLSHDVELLKTTNATVYGFRINKNDTNPNTRVEYMYDAVGMTPARMDFTNDVFDYGSWSSAWFINQNRPVALKFDGTVDYELNHSDFTKKLNGGSSDVLNVAYNGNFMSEIPLVYVKRWEDSNYNYVAFSDKKADENFKAYAHTNASGIIQPKIYLPMFKGSVVSSKLRSIAKQFPKGDTTTANEVSYATACGSGWQIWDWAKHELIADLLTLITKSTDSQTAFGNGNTNSYVSDSTKKYGMLPTGGYNSTVGDISTYSAASNGQFYGKSDYVSHVTVFYIEDFWGNRWERCHGLHLASNVYKVKMTPPYSNSSDSTYTTLSLSPPADSDTWLKNTNSGEFGCIPTEGGGSATTGYCDKFYKSTSSGEKLTIFGGHCHCSTNAWCGYRWIALNTLSTGNVWNVGASPCYCAP